MQAKPACTLIDSKRRYADCTKIICMHLFRLFLYGTCRKDGTKTTTRIRKVGGDSEEFITELRSVLQLPVPKSGNPRDDAIRVRVGGTIEIQGNHVKPVKVWLAGLGF
jgi:translation initiation factor 1 (eIF-1/SUI1)